MKKETTMRKRRLALLLFFYNVLCLSSAYSQSFTVGNMTFKILSGFEHTVELSSVEDVIDSLDIPSSLDFLEETFNVVSIGNRAFSGNNNLVYVFIPSTIKQIGERAFSNTRIKKVDFSEGLEDIGFEAFRDMEITRFSLPNSVERVDYACFKNVQVNIPKSLSYVGGYAFEGCTIEGSVNTIDSICDYAFRSCVFLETEQTLNASYVGRYAFCCTNLTKVILNVPNSGFGAYSFADCKDLKSVSMPDDWLFIPRYAFEGCTRLDNVVLPMSLYNIQEYAFGGTAILEVIFPEGMLYVDGFNNCKNITYVYFPTSVKTISGFLGCNNVERIVFAGNPSGGDFTSSKISEIICYSADPPTNLSFESDCYLSTEVFVPDDALDAYRYSSSWKGFLHIKPLSSSSIIGVKKQDKGSSYYSLGGARVAKPGKGLYIKDGRKVIVK